MQTKFVKKLSKEDVSSYAFLLGDATDTDVEIEYYDDGFIHNILDSFCCMDDWTKRENFEWFNVFLVYESEESRVFTNNGDEDCFCFVIKPNTLRLRVDDQNCANLADIRLEGAGAEKLRKIINSMLIEDGRPDFYVHEGKGKSAGGCFEKRKKLLGLYDSEIRAKKAKNHSITTSDGNDVSWSEYDDYCFPNCEELADFLYFAFTEDRNTPAEARDLLCDKLEEISQTQGCSDIYTEHVSTMGEGYWEIWDLSALKQREINELEEIATEYAADNTRDEVEVSEWGLLEDEAGDENEDNEPSR